MKENGTKIKTPADKKKIEVFAYVETHVIASGLQYHADISTTINYQKAFMFKDADDALDAVLNS